MVIWNILQTFGISYDHLLPFVFIWYIFPVLVSCTKNNLATLIWMSTKDSSSATYNYFSDCAQLLSAYTQQISFLQDISSRERYGRTLLTLAASERT
jgi:hypothetical protein